MKKGTKTTQADLDLETALDNFPKIIKEQQRVFKEKQKDIRRFAALSRKLAKERSKKNKPAVEERQLHPWRACPYGRHWVRTHELRIPGSRARSDDTFVLRHEHCALNPGHRDHLYYDEIQKIAEQHFLDLRHLPCGLNLGRKNGSDFDVLIAGWTKYWNEILKPSELLQPNLVKALISSESEFRATVLANPKNSNSARGLMQITNSSRRILSNTKGEIDDHFITVTREQLSEANINICVGIRWLFHKRSLLTRKAKKDVTWTETVADYKGASTVSKTRAAELMKRFTVRLEKLERCEL